MFRVLNKDKEAIGFVDSNDIKFSKEINKLDVVSFSQKKNEEIANKIEEEFYLEDENHIYIVKSKDIQKTIIRFEGVVSIEEIKAKALKQGLSSKATDVIGTLRLAISGTGWTIKDAGAPTKRRSIDIKKTDNAWDAVEQIINKWKCEYRVDSKNKIIIVKDSFKENKGVYFSNELNAIAITKRSETTKLKTRLYPYGKNNLDIKSINDGKEYIENFQYTDKVIELIWEDNRYTTSENLLSDAKLKLDELSKPFISYGVTIKDLASINPDEYGFLAYELGDIITIIDSETRFRDEQRIVRMDIYKHSPEKNGITLANKFQSFADKQQEQEETQEIIDSIVNENGTIDGTKIDNLKNNIEVHEIKADIINAVEINVGELVANKADIDELHATIAEINHLKANKVDALEFNAMTGKVGLLEGNVANLKDIVNGNITSENMQAGSVTGDRLNMNTVFINDGNIINVNASKINSGEVNTNKVKIKSEDGGVEIVGATQQFRDKNNKVRIQMGKDTKGDFNFIIRGEDGKTTLIDHTGVKEDALADDLIKENMIAPDAVGEKQIDYNSFATGFNKDNNTTIIKATKVRLDNQNQTLEIGFTNLKNQADGTKTQTESNTTQINVQQGQINTAIANTKIVKDGKEVLLKDDYNTTVATVNSIKNTISSHTTKLDEHTGKITGVESKTNILERDVSSMKSTISSTENIVNTHTTQINNTNNKIDNLEIGGRNFLQGDTSKKVIIGENKSNQTLSLGSIDGNFLMGKKVTVSFRYKVTGDNVSGTFKFQTGANHWGALSRTINIDSTNKEGIEIFTGSIYKSEDKTFTNIQARLDNFIGTLELIEIKVELGDKATSWTPAPEYIEEGINKNKNDIITVNTEITTTKNKVSGIEQNLDNVSIKVGSIEKTTTSHTATINSHTSSINAVDGKIDVAKTQAINSASTDAKAKADKALTDAKGFTNTEITKVNTIINNKVAEIKTTTDSINLEVNNTKKEVDKVNVKVNDIQVGGRNYQLNTTNQLKEVSFSGWQYYFPTINIGKDLKSGDIITASCFINPSTLKTRIMIHIDKKDGTYFQATSGKWINPKETGYAIETCKIPEDAIKIRIALRHDSGNAPQDTVLYKELKVEKGNKATDWTPAPEDVSKEILDITTEKVSEAKGEIKVTTDSIINRVSNTESTVTNHTTTINNHTNSLNLVDGKINTAKTQAINSAATDAKTKADKALTDAKGFTNTEITKVNTIINNKVAEIKTTTDSINLEVNNTKKEVDKVNVKVSDIQVGGRNLLRNSSGNLGNTSYWANASLDKNTGYGTLYSIVALREGYAGTTRHQCTNSNITTPLKKNDEITITGWYYLSSLIPIDGDIQLFVRKYQTGNTGTYKDLAIVNIPKGTTISKWINFSATSKLTEDFNGKETFHIAIGKNGKIFVSSLKVEYGNKSTGWSPAPEDVSKEITDTTTEKVNQVKADIKLTTDSISSKVNTIESTTNTINGKVTSHESRLTAAENKITPTAIISTVQNTINTAKNEAINSANSTTNSKLNNYTTKSQFTELKQTSENFQYKIENTTNKYNLINNGSLKNTKNFNLWDQEGVTWYQNDYGTGIQGKMGSNKAYMTSSFIDVSRLDGSFSLAVQAHAQQNTLGAEIQLVGYNSLKDLNVIWGSQKLSFGHLDGKVIRKIEDFSIPSNVNWIKVNVTHFGMTSEYSNVFFIDFINFTNTTIALLDYNLPTKGFAQNIVTIDDSVIRCDFEDGSYSSMGRGGHRYYAKGMSRPYQYITFKSHLPYNKNGQWVKLYLPAMFQGKKIDEDFQLTVTTGAVDSGTNRTGAIRSIFGQVGTWNPNEGSVTVRGCLQRLEVNTLTFTGWDSSTTTEGNEIGGGYIDLIVTAQM